MKNQFHDLLQAEMSRKDFLKTLGIGMLALIGLPQFLKVVGPKGISHVTRGYGSNPYGK